jgi:hypothetical protein
MQPADGSSRLMLRAKSLCYNRAPFGQRFSLSVFFLFPEYPQRLRNGPAPRAAQNQEEK